MSNYIIEKNYDFIPEYDKDVTFKLRALTASQREECIQSRIINGEAEIIINKTKLFNYGVASIDNLTVNDAEIKTAKEFSDNLIPPIYEEVISKLIESTAKKDSKN